MPPLATFATYVATTERANVSLPTDPKGTQKLHYLRGRYTGVTGNIAKPELSSHP